MRNTKHDETVYHLHRGLQQKADFAIRRKQIAFCNKFLVYSLLVEMIMSEYRKSQAGTNQ